MLGKIIWEADVTRTDIEDCEPQRFYFWFKRSVEKFAKKINESQHYRCSWGGEILWFKYDRNFDIPDDELIDDGVVKNTNLQEVKHGHWIRMSDADGLYYECSACCEDLPRISAETATYDNPFPEKYAIEPTKFCPNCGAKMDEEK